MTETPYWFKDGYNSQREYQEAEQSGGRGITLALLLTAGIGVGLWVGLMVADMALGWVYAVIDWLGL